MIRSPTPIAESPGTRAVSTSTVVTPSLRGSDAGQHQAEGAYGAPDAPGCDLPEIRPWGRRRRWPGDRWSASLILRSRAVSPRVFRFSARPGPAHRAAARHRWRCRRPAAEPITPTSRGAWPAPSSWTRERRRRRARTRPSTSAAPPSRRSSWRRVAAAGSDRQRRRLRRCGRAQARRGCRPRGPGVRAHRHRDRRFDRSRRRDRVGPRRPGRPDRCRAPGSRRMGP